MCAVRKAGEFDDSQGFEDGRYEYALEQVEDMLEGARDALSALEDVKIESRLKRGEEDS